MENYIFYRNKFYYWEWYGFSGDGDVQIEFYDEQGPISPNNPVYFELEEVFLKEYGDRLDFIKWANEKR